MLATIASATVLGVEGLAVTVEVHESAGLPGFSIVGLPDASCREARDRVRAAVLSSDLKWPNRRMTVNLAPSGHRKVGSSLDLAIAVGVLAASQQVPLRALEGAGFVGELGLDGSVRGVPGLLAMVDSMDTGAVVVPVANQAEASLPGRHEVRPVGGLAEVAAALRGRRPWQAPVASAPKVPEWSGPDLSEVRGQMVARRSLELAAAGGHNLLLVGPPGAGKTLLAERLPGLLPPLTPEAALEASRIHSAAGVSLPPDGLVRLPPMRCPHHSASLTSLVGGGSHQLRPGEISLATGGVLFLDELAEFPAHVLDALRTPLEEGVVRIARANARATLPARFQLVAAMNPCPCGGDGGPGGCRCSRSALARYARRISGPLLDRFDLQVHVPPPEAGCLLDAPNSESTAVVAARVRAARERATRRSQRCNASLSASELEELAPISPEALASLERVLRQGRLSARGLRRVRAVALTITDLAGSDPPVGREAVLEAIYLREADPRGVPE